MDEQQAEIKPVKTVAIARRNCRRCFGRGYSGREVKTGYYIRCSCVKIVEVKE